MNVMVHGHIRAKRGKGPSLAIGVIKNPRQALYLARRLVDTEMCLDSFNEDDDRKEMQNLLLVITGKKTFLECAKTLEKDRPDFAIKLKKASTHWLRHTAITHQADAGIELRYIKRNARHENVETTMLYQHAEEDKWHALA